jgi:succinyl-diaminopimelate desuccinylase
MEKDFLELKKILAQLVSIDGGFERKINDFDFDFIKNFLEENNFNQIQIVHDENDASNLFATQINDQQREKEIDLMFLGHLDVVDPGDAKKWKNQNPFVLFEEDGVLYGRGAVDMKGSIAAFLHAISKISKTKINFNLGMMIVSDEEKESRGAIALKNFLIQEGWKINQILIGEPTSEKEIGDVIKIGRRGSANFDVFLKGAQGHVAYPDLAQNPIHEFLPNLLFALKNFQFNDKNEFFDSSNLVITAIETSPKHARNVSPDEVKISFNIRYNSEKDLESLKSIIKNLIVWGAQIPEKSFNLEIFSNFGPFLSEKTKFCDAISHAIQKIKGFSPKIKTNGGTSDGRFFHDIAPIVEFGPLNFSAHKIDEHIHSNDLYSLSKIYEELMISLNSL